MDSAGSELCRDEEGGERCIGESSYKTPVPSAPDTCVTSTTSCPSTSPGILYGDFQMKSCKGHSQLTLALIKPDGMKYIHEIEKRIKDEGFDIVQMRTLRLSPEQASNFYNEHYGREYFPLLVVTMCDGPIRVYVLRKKEAVVMWRATCGPTCVYEAKKVWPESLRAIYGTTGEVMRNVCHASATVEKAYEEIRFFFPNMILDENFTNEFVVEYYMNEMVNPTLLEGLTQLCKIKPPDPILWLATWLLTNNPYKPKLPEKIALTPT